MPKQNCRDWIITLSVIFVLFNVSCDKYKKTEETKFIMGTIVDIKIYQTDKEKALDSIKKAFDEIDRVDLVFSNFKENSFISKINKNSGTWVDVSGEVIELIELSIKYSNLTDGAFDISIAPIINLWGFGSSRKYYIPSDKEISDNLSLVNYKNIEIDKEKNKIRIKKGMLLDMNGIVKSYVLNRVIKVLRENGIKNAVVNAGGDVFVIGEKKNGVPFNIGIQNPRQEKEILATLKVSDAAIVTSGDYENYFIESGKRYHHIFNPKTGQPSDLCQSVTIISSSAAEVFSAGVFVLGPEKGLKLVESLSGVECFIVDGSGKIIKSKGFNKYIEKN